MLSPTGESALSFNGELFDIAGLRDELADSGVAFRGTSDTEVLLHALLKWGMPGALTRIEGQFAFAWFDGRSRVLYLARDRAGIRPLYYAHAPDRLAAGSEQKSLLLLPWVDRTPRREALLRYLLLERTDDVPFETMLKGVTHLPAGHWASWDGTELKVRRYYRVDGDPPAATISQLRVDLERAVSTQLVSDVPVGSFVSGGLDSSTVALLADQSRVSMGINEPLHLFAYHDAAAEKDEREYQQAVIDAFRSPTRVHWVSSSPSALSDAYAHYVHHQEEPYGDVSSYAEYCIAREAKHAGVKVLLNGLGGDEVFTGYGSYFGPLMHDLVRAGDLRGLRALFETAGPIAGRTHGAKRDLLLAACYHALPGAARNALTAFRTSRDVGLEPRLVAIATRDAAIHWHRHDGRIATNAALRGSLESWSVPRFLAHSDRMSLAFGVEGRVPLLDDRVVRTAFGIPAHQRVSRRGVKESLRLAMTDVLPPLVRDRTWKLGFHAPLAHYVQALEGPLREGIARTSRALETHLDWETLGLGARWRCGNLGAYLGWVSANR